MLTNNRWTRKSCPSARHSGARDIFRWNRAAGCYECAVIPDSDELVRLDKAHLWHPFTPMREWCAADHEPLILVEGKGCMLRDRHGREYLDGNASIIGKLARNSVPLGRAGTPEEVAAVIAFMASPSCAYMTGETVLLDGGYALGPGIHIGRDGKYA